jgi:hypothetical protein
VVTATGAAVGDELRGTYTLSVEGDFPSLKGSVSKGTRACKFCDSMRLRAMSAPRILRLPNERSTKSPFLRGSPCERNRADRWLTSCLA